MKKDEHIENRDEFAEILGDKLGKFVSPDFEVPSWKEFEEYARKKKALAGRDKPLVFMFMRYAAIGLLFVGLGIGVYHFFSGDNSKEIVSEVIATKAAVSVDNNQKEPGEKLLVPEKTVDDDENIGQKEVLLLVAEDVSFEDSSNDVREETLNEKINPYFVGDIYLAALNGSESSILYKQESYKMYDIEEYLSELEAIDEGEDASESKWGTALFADGSINTLSNTNNEAPYRGNVNSELTTLPYYDKNSEYDYAGSEKDHQPPLSVSLSVGYAIASHVSLESGVVYSYLYSTSNDFFRTFSQKVHYVGIPVSVMYNFLPERSSYNLYSIAGLMAEKAVSAKVITNIYDVQGSSVCERTSVNTPKIMLSGNAGFGMGYDFLSSLGIYAETYVGYYFYTKDQPITFKTEDNVNIHFRIGMRYKF